MNNLLNQFNKFKKIKFVLFLLNFVFVSFVVAWTGPTDNPPNGNASSPLNVSTSTQSKLGSLSLGGDADSNYRLTLSGGGIKSDSTDGIGGYFSSTNSYGLIVNSGNVGVATTSPTHKLDVNGTGRFTDVLTTKEPTVYDSVTKLITAPINVPEASIEDGKTGFVPLIRGRTRWDTTGYRKHISIGSYRTGSLWDGGIYLAQGGNNDNYPTEYFLLGSAGSITHSSGVLYTTNNVGIGTTSPGAKLDVYGDTRIRNSANDLIYLDL